MNEKYKVNGIELAQEIDNMIHNMPNTLRWLDEQAYMFFSYFKSLKEAGFTEREALEIIKSRGIT